MLAAPTAVGALGRQPRACAPVIPVFADYGGQTIRDGDAFQRPEEVIIARGVDVPDGSLGDQSLKFLTHRPRHAGAECNNALADHRIFGWIQRNASGGCRWPLR